MLSRFRRGEDGSVAILAAVTFPVVLLCVGMAMAAMVWASSEHETQRAADAAAVRAAATAFLGTDFPYQELPGVTAPVTYPDIDAIAALVGQPAPDGLDECGTVGLPPEVSTAGLSLPVDCSAVGPYAPPVAIAAADESRSVACSTARAAMSPDAATYANRFYTGEDDSQPSCDNKRVDVELATGSPLIGFGQYATDSASGLLDTQVASQYPSVRTALAAFGIRLDTSLPSLLCPEVSVEVDQPVREPVFDRAATPNGRATARRIVKNAVIVPVYEGRTIAAAAEGAVRASSSGEGVEITTSTGATVTIPPSNLNAPLLDAQAQLLALLDEVDAIADAAIRAANVSLDQLNGVYEGIDATEPQPAPTAGAEPLEGLRLTKCLRDTLAQVYDPPSGDAPTSQEVLADAAETGDQVIVVQVGAVSDGCTEPGAIEYAPPVPSPSPTPECIRAATTPHFDPTTGLYEVPFFDVTPVIVQDIGDGNYAAVPVHATQASGAFRGALVRAAGNERYDPTLERPRPTPLCDATVPAPAPATACDILSASPDPVPTPTLPLPTLPVVVPTSSSPTPMPSPTCVLLCGLGP